VSPPLASSRARIIAVLLLLTVLAGCAVETDSDVGIQIVATTSIVGDIATGVVGDRGVVDVLIPIGVDAHDFQPSAQQAQLIAAADLVVANGLGLEQGLEDVLDAAAADGTSVIELAPQVDPLPFSDPGNPGDDDLEAESLDPHFWMDPIRVGEAAVALAGVLSASHPDDGWEDRAREYAAGLEATDLAIHDLVDVIPSEQRIMVTNHEAFGYFAARYGFEVIGVVVPGGSTLAEPSSAELAGLIETMEREGVRVIFAETTQPSTLAEAIAAELGNGVQVVELFTETLGPPGSGAETIAEMLVTNAERISDAMG